RPGEQLTGRGAAEELRATEMHVVQALDAAQVDVLEGERPVRADAVPRRAVTVGTDRDHAGRGLHVRQTHDPAGVDALAVEQREQRVADRVLAGRPDA